MSVSAFFPHAPHPTPAPPPPPPAEPLAVAAPAALIRSAPPFRSEQGSTAVGLRFPAARKHLWDRTPQGAPQTLRAPTVQIVLAAHDLEGLCAQARGAAPPQALQAVWDDAVAAECV